jgi:ankyrin repeat protein
MRVEESAIPLVRRTLQWITYATPKLTVEELTEIVSLDEDDDMLNPEAFPDPEDLLRLCGSLIRRAHQSLELAHFTVQEFLEAIQPEDIRLNKFRLCATDKLTLAKTCVTYLCLPSFDRPPLGLIQNDRGILPFSKHATEHLLEYLSDFWSNLNSFEWLKRLFSPQKSYNLTYFFLSRHAFYMTGPRSQTGDKFANYICAHEFGTLHAAASLRMDKLCQWLIEQGCDPNQPSPLGVPLECAIWGSSHFFDALPDVDDLHKRDAQETIRVLVNAGAACNIKPVHDASLSYATMLGPLDPFGPFMLMLSHGMSIQPDAVSGLEYYRRYDLLTEESVLRIVEQSGAETPKVRMQLLELSQRDHLKTSATIPPARTMTEEVFHEAITYSIRFCVLTDFLDLACDPRFVVNMARPHGSGTLLHLAIEHQAVSLLRILLDRGFDPILTDNFGRTALHDTIRFGILDDDVLRRLIASDAPDVADKEGRTVWHYAAAAGSHQTVKLLFEKSGPETRRFQERCKKGLTPLLEAIKYRQSACASLLLKFTQADPSAAEDERIVHYAVAHGLHSLIQEMLDHGTDLRVVSEYKRNALFYSTSLTTCKVLDLLLSHGLNPSHVDVCGKPPVSAYFARDNPGGCREVLGCDCLEFEHQEPSIFEKLVTSSSVSIPDHDGHTTWYYFCTKFVPFIMSSTTPAKDDYVTSVVSVLVRYGALAAYEDITSASGLNLFVEMFMNSVDSPLYLMMNGSAVADSLLNAVCTVGDRSDFVKHPQTVRLLIWAIIEDHQPMIEKLLELGTDVHSASEFYDGYSAVDTCIVHNMTPAIFDRVLEHADTDRLATLEGNGDYLYFRLCDPSLYVGMWGNIKKLEAILKAGVDPNKRAPNSRVAAHIAAKSGFLEALQLLVRFGADIRLATTSGWTVLHGAVDFGHLSLLRYCREQIRENDIWTATFACFGPKSGSYPSVAIGPLPVSAYYGCNLLHLAVMTKAVAVEILQFLRETGCFENIDARTQEGVTPLHFAACSTSPVAIRWLISNGADVDVKIASSGETALHVALKQGNLTAALALLEAGVQFQETTAKVLVHPDIRAELLDTLNHCDLSIPPFMLRALTTDYKLYSSGDFYRAILDGDLEKCRSIVESGQLLNESPHECGTCTPLIIALARQKVDIVGLLLQKGASTEGIPCWQTRQLGTMFNSAIHIAIAQPIFNNRLEELLKLALNHDSHWGHHNSCEPLHLAAAFNPGGIEIFVDHIRTHEQSYM